LHQAKVQVFERGGCPETLDLTKPIVIRGFADQMRVVELVVIFIEELTLAAMPML